MGGVSSCSRGVLCCGMWSREFLNTVSRCRVAECSRCHSPGAGVGDATSSGKEPGMAEGEENASAERGDFCRCTGFL